MSGGAHNYAYRGVEDMADALASSRSPLRRAFAKHLRQIAKAMHDIEWVDSADTSSGSENSAIVAALSNGDSDAELVVKAAKWDNLVELINDD